jgi:hypothetical protein
VHFGNFGIFPTLKTPVFTETALQQGTPRDFWDFWDFRRSQGHFTQIVKKFPENGNSEFDTFALFFRCFSCFPCTALKSENPENPK